MQRSVFDRNGQGNASEGVGLTREKIGIGGIINEDNASRMSSKGRIRA